MTGSSQPGNLFGTIVTSLRRHVGLFIPAKDGSDRFDHSGLPDMITANDEDVARRIEEGFLGLLMSGPDADEHIEVGRAAAGR